MFGRPKKPRLTLQQALAAKPVRSSDADVERRDDGATVVKVKLRQAGLFGRLVRMPAGATKSFELDPIGRLVWDACDGKTSVRRIIRAVAGECKISEREAQVATVAFLQMLTKKGLVGIRVDDAGDDAAAPDDGARGFEVVPKR